MSRLIDWKCEGISARACCDIFDTHLFEATLVGTPTEYSFTKTNTLDDVVNELEGLVNSCKLTKIKKVIFNPPATIIIWNDGTKSVVKCQNGEPYDAEKGFVLAYLKKLLGNDNTFNKEINKWVDYEKVKDKHIHIGGTMYNIIKRITIMDDENLEKVCRFVIDLYDNHEK